MYKLPILIAAIALAATPAFAAHGARKHLPRQADPMILYKPGAPTAKSAIGEAIDASAVVRVSTISNGPVPDTAENRARYGGPMSHAGQRTAPVGNTRRKPRCTGASKHPVRVAARRCGASCRHSARATTALRASDNRAAIGRHTGSPSCPRRTQAVKSCAPAFSPCRSIRPASANLEGMAT